MNKQTHYEKLKGIVEGMDYKQTLLFIEYYAGKEMDTYAPLWDDNSEISDLDIELVWKDKILEDIASYADDYGENDEMLADDVKEALKIRGEEEDKECNCPLLSKKHSVSYHG